MVLYPLSSGSDHTLCFHGDGQIFFKSINSMKKEPFSFIATFKLDSSISESDQTNSQVSIDVWVRFPLRIASLPCSMVVSTHQELSLSILHQIRIEIQFAMLSLD